MVAVCSDTTIHRRYLNATGGILIKILTPESILITGGGHIAGDVMGSATLSALLETAATARDTPAVIDR